MDIDKQKWTSLQTRIFSLVCLKSGQKLSQRDIAKSLKVSPMAISKAIPPIIKTKLINLEKTKTINFIFFNRDETKAIEYKRVENLQQIYSSDFSDYLKDELPGGTIILFGSYSLGEDTNLSDIDIAIVGRKEKTLKLDKYEKYLERKISLHFFPSWKEMPTHLKNNIVRGIVLHGTVEL